MSELQRIAVLGAGTMGHGIAYIAAQAGLEVALYDVSGAAIERGLGAIAKIAAGAVEKNKLSQAEASALIAHVHAAPELKAAVATADVIIEAVPENLELKQTLFRGAASHAPAHALFGTNTSSLSVSEIGSVVADPTRFIGLHFFNPPYVMKLLEIVRAESTSAESVARAQALGTRLGREMIVVSDAPGFATSRLGLVLGLEAIRMLEQGVASAADIDRAMEQGYRHPMGPLRLTDLVGLDVRLAIAEYLHSKLGAQFEPPALLRQLVAEGKLGKKTGEGFFSW